MSDTTIPLTPAQLGVIFGHASASAYERGQSPASSATSERVAAQLHTLTEIVKAMSSTLTQEQADVAQLAQDVQTLTAGIGALKDQIVTLKQAADASSGTVPADLQAQIDALHALAQTVAPVVPPAPADSNQAVTALA